MLIFDNLDKNNLYHAYLIEGTREEVLPEILKFIKSLGVKTTGNPDLVNISIDNFKIDEALELRAMSTDKGFSAGKKIFIICANTFSLDAENVMLKMFEEPIENTHFFLVVPDVNILLKTLVSRFYLIKTESALDLKEAEKFIAMPLNSRINFLKDFLAEEEEEISPMDSIRAKSLRFINALEISLHSKFVNNFSGLTLPGVPGGTHTIQNSSQTCFSHFFKVREFLRMPGSSTKNLMESVALIIPML